MRSRVWIKLLVILALVGLFSTASGIPEKAILIFIDRDTYRQLTQEIERFKADIAKDLGVNVSIQSGNWQRPQPIREIIKDYYQNHGLLGSILIGEIPTAYFEYQDRPNVITDRYYQDLSDWFVDSDGDGQFEREHYMSWNEVTMQEVWSARLKPPISGPQGIALLRDYFNRNHAYRTGQLSYHRKMLYFDSVWLNDSKPTQDEYLGLARSIDDYTGLYSSDEQIDAIYHSDPAMQRGEYLAKLKIPYEFAYISIHGTETTQSLHDSVPVITVDELKAVRPQPLFTVIFACSNGNFTERNYFASWFLFGGGGLVVKAATVMIMNVVGEVYAFEPYMPLGAGVIFGEMYQYDNTFLGIELFGDPTLRLRDKPKEDLPKLELSISAYDLDFGVVPVGQEKESKVTFSNSGEGRLRVIRGLYGATVNGRVFTEGPAPFRIGICCPTAPAQCPRDSIHCKDVLDGQFVLDPQARNEVTFRFAPPEGLEGHYAGAVFFYTNDPDQPYLVIRMTGWTPTSLPGNLVQNHNFDNWLPGAPLPPYWNVGVKHEENDAPGDPQAIRQTTDAHSGNFAVQLGAETAAPGEGYAIISQDILNQITPGKTYEFSLWVKGWNPSGSLSARAYVWWLDAVGNYLYPPTDPRSRIVIDILASPTYQLLKASGEAPTGAASARIQIGKYSWGFIRVDDVSLMPK